MGSADVTYVAQIHTYFFSRTDQPGIQSSIVPMQLRSVLHSEEKLRGYRTSCEGNNKQLQSSEESS
jgi:hypothetical protein